MDQYKSVEKRIKKSRNRKFQMARPARHTWASWLAQQETPMNVLQELGGWESEKMVRRYANLSKSQLMQHAELVSNVFIGTNLAHPNKKEVRENL